MAKTIAAIGALKIDDMAPAAAHPMSRLRSDWFIWKMRARFELMADPVATVGPSSPTDPPNPTVMGAVSSEPYIWYLRMIPFFLEIA